jgi:hypothetical protein
MDRSRHEQICFSLDISTIRTNIDLGIGKVLRLTGIVKTGKHCLALRLERNPQSRYDSIREQDARQTSCDVLFVAGYDYGNVLSCRHP